MKRYLELLAAHLARQKDDFDEWHLWLNTNVAEDVQYIKELEAKYSGWVRVIQLAEPVTEINNLMISKFYPIDSVDPDALYLRLDDDIVWLQDDFVRSMFVARSDDKEHFLVYGNIINNAIVSYIQQRFGNIEYGVLTGYQCMDPIGWAEPAFAEQVHRFFLAALDQQADVLLDRWRFRRWIMHEFERVSINCMSWRGADFAAFGGCVGDMTDEEQWLSCDKPRELNITNVIYGQALCAHFAFSPQRGHLDTTNILEQYARHRPTTQSTT